MTHSASCRVAALLVALGLLPRAHAQEPAAPPAPVPRLVLAHYIPGFPALGIDPGNEYWWCAPYDPASGSRSLTTRPILYTTGAKDYKLQGVVDEIKIAKAYGIDGFMVDELEDNDGYRTAWLRLLKAAEIVGNFKIGLQPDFATLGASGAGGGEPARTQSEKMKHWIDLAKDSPALLRFGGKPVVMPYGAGAPDARHYGTFTYPEGEKRDVVDWFAAQGEPIAYAAMHCLSWPIYTNPYANAPKTGFQTFAFATATFSPGDNVDTMVDDVSVKDGQVTTTGVKVNTRQRALDYWPPAFMQVGEAGFMYENPGLHWFTAPRLSTPFRQDWAWNVAHRDRIQWVELITWNDWGESAIAPSTKIFMALQPVTRYYADWFKTGRAPKITKDAVTLFHREAPIAAAPTKYPNRVGGPVPSDEVEALALLTAPSTLVLKSGDKEYRQAVGAGIQSLIKPFALGIQSARIERHGIVVASITSPMPIHDKPLRDNMWISGATSAYPPRPIGLTGWTAASGDWTGELSTRSGTGLSLVGNSVQLANVSVSAFATPETVVDGSFVGVVAHANSPGGKVCFYRLALGQWDGKGQWRLSKTEGGKETILASGDATVTARVRHGLRLDCVGEYLIPYLDGRLLTGDVADWPDWPLTYGQAGVAAEGTPAKFTGISLKSYDPAL